jgi:hypothetical protein
MDRPIVAWKFDVELPQPGGGVLPLVCYVKLPDRGLAAKALIKAYPKANFRINRATPVSDEKLDEAFPADSLSADEVVRCVQSS